VNAQRLQKIIQENPSLVWYTNDTANLSDASIFEHILNYGTWNQVQESIKLLGLKDTINLYKSLVDTKRSNIRPRVKHYFNLYFANASRNFN